MKLIVGVATTQKPELLLAAGAHVVVNDYTNVNLKFLNNIVEQRQ